MDVTLALGKSHGPLLTAVSLEAEILLQRESKRMAGSAESAAVARGQLVARNFTGLRPGQNAAGDDFTQKVIQNKAVLNGVSVSVCGVIGRNVVDVGVQELHPRRVLTDISRKPSPAIVPWTRRRA